jgi:glycogen(starch) synthase
MRIMIFSHDFLPLLGGVQTYVTILAGGLIRDGHDVVVVTNSAGNGFRDCDLSFRVIRQPSLIELWRIIGAVDVMQLAGPVFLPLLLGLLRGSPVVIEHHGYQPICPNGTLLYAPDRKACPGHFMDGAYQKCLRCFATTDGWFHSLCALLLTFPRRWMCKEASINAPITEHVLNRLQLPRSLVIRYGIPDRPSQNQPLISIRTEAPCFAYVGRLVVEKGLSLLVEAANRLRENNYDFRLKFIGDGPERTRLEEMVSNRSLTGHVTFTGFLNGEALRQATEDVIVMVMPSIWEETAGLSAIEQMMRGRLVIVADIGGLGEVVDGAGLKFTAGNVDQLTACMRQVLDEPTIVNEFGQRARRRSLDLFREIKMVENHLTVYRELLKIKTQTS